MGWLGWDFETVQRSDVNVIAMALDGREELLASIFGGGESGKRRGPITANEFMAFARRHNAQYRRRPNG